MFTIWTVPLQGQMAVATSQLDTNSIMLGDQINLNLKLSVPEESVVFWPFVLSDTLYGPIEIVKNNEPDTLSIENQVKTIQQKLLITCFDSGFYMIPAFPFEYKLPGDTTTYAVETLPVALEVVSPETDPEADIKPIKPPIHAPVTFKEIAPWLLGGLLLIALIILGIYIYRKRKKAEPIFRIRTKPALPPHVVALDEFERLRMKKLWQSGKVKSYYSELTDIIRIYIEGRYNILAPEMVTDEIIESLEKMKIDHEAVKKLQETLSLADLVKFAKAQPLPLENDTSLNRCVDFVKETRLLIQPETEKKDGVESSTIIEKKEQ